MKLSARNAPPGEALAVIKASDVMIGID